MLEVRHALDGVSVYDTEADEGVVTFATRAVADEPLATPQIQDVHAPLPRWSPDAVPTTY